MAEEQVPALPDELDRWLDERAAATEQGRDELLARAVATYRLLSENEEALSGEAPTLDERIDELQGRLDDLETETDDRINDVRERVVQELKTAKEKADPEHDHPELADDIDAIDSELDEVSTSVSSLSGELDSLQERVDGGFENYETVLTSLTDRADDIDSKLDTLAGAVVGLRKRAVELESANARRAAVEEIQATANRQGVRAGNCESCDQHIELGLLAEPRCPHCQQPLAGVEPGGRFIGSATVTVGDQPALAGDSMDAETPEELFEDDE